jgi:hypothetical protein
VLVDQFVLVKGGFYGVVEKLPFDALHQSIEFFIDVLLKFIHKYFEKQVV